MSSHEIFSILAWIGIIGLLFYLVAGLISVYNGYKFLRKLTKIIKEFFEETDVKEIIEQVTSKGSAVKEPQVFNSLEQFLEGYKIGIADFLQKELNNNIYSEETIKGAIDKTQLLIDLANSLDEIKEQGHFFITVPSQTPFRAYKVLFEEKDEKEQENEARD